MSPAVGDVGKPSGHYIPDVLPMHGPETAETRKDCMALRGFLPSLGCLGVGSGVESGFHSALPFQPLCILGFCSQAGCYHVTKVPSPTSF